MRRAGRIALFSLLALVLVGAAAAPFLLGSSPPPLTCLTRATKLRTITGEFPGTGMRFTASVYELKGDFLKEVKNAKHELLEQKGWGYGEVSLIRPYRYHEFRHTRAGLEIIDGRVGDFEFRDRQIIWDTSTWKPAQGVLSIVYITEVSPLDRLMYGLRRSLGNK